MELISKERPEEWDAIAREIGKSAEDCKLRWLVTLSKQKPQNGATSVEKVQPCKEEAIKKKERKSKGKIHWKLLSCY